MRQRRQFIKSTGAALTIGIIGEPAFAEEKKAGSDEIGLTEEVKQLFSEGENEKAIRLLDNNDVKYNYSEKDIHPADSRGGGMVSPQWNYSDDCISILLILRSNDDDRWAAMGSSNFVGSSTESSVGTPNKVADACGIVFSSSEWSALEPSSDGVTYSDSSGINIEHDEYNPNYGPTALVHHKYGGVSDSRIENINMVTDLTRIETGNDNIPVQFAYEHTYALTGITGSTSVSIAYGALSVSVPLGASKAWREEVTAAP